MIRYVQAFAAAMAAAAFPVAVACAQSAVFPVVARQPSVSSSFAKLPLHFEVNQGQFDPGVQFVARSPGATVYLAGADAVLRTSSFHADPKQHRQSISGSVVRMHLLGAAAQPEGHPEAPLPGRVNYIHGDDSAQWQRNLPVYSGVRLQEVYPGVDLRYYGHAGTLEYDFLLAPGADPAAIALQFQGANPVIEPAGELKLSVKGDAPLHFDRPIAYQERDGRRVAVEASYRRDEHGRVRFALGDYDHSQALVIDPTLVFLGTLGAGAANETTSQITVDSNGSMYFVGTTSDAAFPTTTGAYQTVCGPSGSTASANGLVYCNGGNGGNTSAYITKLSADGTQLVYSTYLSGHSGYEQGTSIAVDSQGVAYVLGLTGSNDFPVTANAFQSQCTAYYGFNGIHTNLVPCDGFYNGGGTEYTVLNTIAFFAKLSADGSSLTYSSYLGGTSGVTPIATALDASGNWVIEASTGVFDAADLAGGIVNQGQIQYPGITPTGYLTGSTASSGDISSAVTLSEFSNDGTKLLYGTFFGDNTTGVAVSPTSLAIGANGIAFVGGYTDATNLPTTANAIKGACTQPGTNYGGEYCDTFDGFVASFDTTKSGAASLVYSTRLGGSTPTQGSNTPEQVVYGIHADGANDLYATGYTQDPTFPVGSGGYISTCPSGCNFAFVVKVDPTGTQLLSGSFLGGNNGVETVGRSVTLDSKGQVYLYGSAGLGGSGVPQVNPLPNNNGANDIFISTFSADLSQLLFSSLFTNPSYPDHSVAAASGGLALDPQNNIYLAGTTTDDTFAGTPGTHNDSTNLGGQTYPRTFFAKLSPVLQPVTAALTLSPTTANEGDTITYDVAITGTAQNMPPPSGTVTVQSTTAGNSTPVTLGTATLSSTGTASFTGPAPATGGSYSVTAVYAGDENYNAATSPAVTLAVNDMASTKLTLTSSAASAAPGQSITLTAQVTSTISGTPTGTVTFLDNGTTLGTATLSNGTAAFTVSSLAAGANSFTATYSGDGNFVTSTSSAVTVSVIALAPTTTTLTSSAAGANAGVSVTFTAQVTSTAGGTPTGTVAFFDGTTQLGMGTLAGGTATYATTSLSVATHTITAVYSGDTNFLTSTSAALQETITANTIALSGTPTSLTFSSGSSGTTTVTVTPSGVYSGTVTLSCNSLPATLSCGFAPSSLVFNGSSTAQSSTLTVSSSSAAAFAPMQRRGGAPVVFALLGLPCGLLIFGRRRSARWFRLSMLLALFSLSVLTLGLTGCGGGSSTTGAGTYAIQVVASVNGSANQTLNLSVTVQ